MSINNYREIDAINQSFLKRMFSSINEIKSKKINHGMIIGDGVDTLMFTPDLFSEKFTVYDGEIPTANPEKIIRKGLEEGILFDDLLYVARELGLYSKNHDEVVINKLLPFQEYYDLITTNTRIISREDLNLIMNTTSRLYDSYTGNLVRFLNKFGETQKILVGNLEGIKVKGLSDWIVFNPNSALNVSGIHIPKNSLLVADLKVGAFNPENVEGFVMKWNIGFQLTFYSLIAQQMTGLNICNPVVVYANPKCSYTSYYQFPDELVEQSKEQIKQAIKIYKQYNNDYSVHYLIKENNGLIKSKIWV